MDQPLLSQNNITSGFDDDRTNPTESTPLLPDLNDTKKVDSEDVPKMMMFWQEMRTILTFALPVLGSVILNLETPY